MDRRTPVKRWLARRWPWVVIVGSSLVIIVSLRPLIGSTDWAGLGQWVGGLGALFAAWAALKIARDEAGRENRREKERLRVEAHYIVSGADGSDGSRGFQVWVRNTGKEPVTNVDVVALHVEGVTQTFVVECAPSPGQRAVLLPDGLWHPWVTPVKEDLTAGLVLRVMDTGPIPEIRFEDLGGTRWGRIGERPPFEVEVPPTTM